jgi:anti-sigma regulatory factor (Ser/Thr protein kinase)
MIFQASYARIKAQRVQKDPAASRSVIRFRTLEDIARISGFMERVFRDAAHVVSDLGELMLNAVEHGNLGISYEEKTGLVLQGRWEEEIRRRLALPEYAGRYASLSYELKDHEIHATIRDDGAGFCWRDYLELSDKRSGHPNGRGIALARMRSFPSLKYNADGNEVTCAAVFPGLSTKSNLYQEQEEI